MSKKLHISDSLDLPADIGTETIAILGRRGSGKSNTGTALIEELIAAGQQVVLLDPKGEGWGLKAQGAGGPGLDVIVFGEPEGDLPLREEHAETIADFVVTSGRSCVLSLAGFDSDAAARRFVARFAERLFNLKKKPENRSPLMVVLEEAHLFIPQRVEGAQAEVASRLQRLVRQGRSMGLGVMLIDQRPASVNKDVLTQIELMICHQLTSPHDRKAVDAWIEANAEREQAEEFRRTLVSLQPGEAWVWSPAKLKVFERAKIRRRNTFDSGATPILGKDAAKRPKMREVDLEGLRVQLDRVVEEKKANDPTELKKKLAAAEKALAAAQAAKPAPAAKEKIVEKPVITDKQIGRLEALQERAWQRVEAWWKRASAGINPLMELLNGQKAEIIELRHAISAAIAVPPPVLRTESPPAVQPKTFFLNEKHTTHVKREARATAATPSSSGSLPKGELAVLTAVAQTDGGCNREQLSVLTGYKRSSRDTYLQRLREKSLIDQHGDQILATGGGLAALGPDFRPLPTGSALREHWMQRLPEGERRVLDVLISEYPNFVDRSSIDDATNYKRSSRDTYLQRLGARQLVEISRDGVRASAQLFDDGESLR